MAVKGRWEGKLVDATGVSAAIELNLVERKGRLSGDFSTYFIAEDAGCSGPVRRLAQSGVVRGTYSPKSKIVRLKYAVTIGLEPVDVSLEARLSDAGNHARQALVGCYTAGGGKDLTLQGGGIVLWQYRAR